MFAVNIRLVLENFRKYGVLVALPADFGDGYSNLVFAKQYAIMIICTYIPWLIERYVAPLSRKDRGIANLLHVVFFSVLVICPWRAVYYDTNDLSVMHGLGILALQCTSLMKVWSFWHTCSDLWSIRYNSGNKKQVQNLIDDVFSDSPESKAVAEKYPECLSFFTFVKYMCYPTLVFQLWYPKIPGRPRLPLLSRYLLEIIFAVALMYILTEQYMRPLLTNTVQLTYPFWVSGNWRELSVRLIERLLKLAVPNLYVWLLVFTSIFHSWMNFLAELTRFGDHQFYLDWWNARSFRDYWQKWNLPVHYWIQRHMYRPLRGGVVGVGTFRAAVSRPLAVFTTFLVSGLVHEYLIMVPLRLNWRFCWITTLAFVTQLPLVILTDTEFVKKRPIFGNCLFWLTFCFTGQPVAVLFYFGLKLVASNELTNHDVQG